MPLDKIKAPFKPKGLKMTKVQKKTEDQVMLEAILIDELTKHYGVEFTAETDKKQFIRDLTKESHRVAKERSPNDPRKEALFEEKIAKLRQIWAEELEVKPTAQQKELEQKLKDEGYRASVTFPDEESYLIQAGGQEDSGSMSAGIPAILGNVERMTNPAGY